MKKLILLALFATACGTTDAPEEKNQNTPPPGQNLTDPFVGFRQTNIRFADGRYFAGETEGSLIRNEAFVSSNEVGKRFLLDFSLTSATSEATFVSYAKSDLSQGVEFKFKYHEHAGELHLEFEVVINGSEKFEYDIDDESIDPSQVKIALEIHNDETPAHIMIFNGEKELFNSEGQAGFPETKGVGTYWGWKLKNSSVGTTTVTEPANEH